MKHAFPEEDCIQEVTVAQQMARAYLGAPPELKATLARRLACEVLGLRSSRRHYDQPIEGVDGLTRLIPHDEPVFLIRAEHVMGVEAMKTWLSEAEKVNTDPDLLKLVRAQIKEMEAWPVKRVPALQKDPEGQSA